MEGMGMNRDFWAGKRVLITGHSGFKGSWLCLWLNRLGAKVAGVSLVNEQEKSIFNAANVSEFMEKEYFSDVCELGALKEIISAYSPSIVFHLAAQPLVRESYRRPIETYLVNVMGTLNVLESIRAVETVRACVVVTSDKCYENNHEPSRQSFTEGMKLGGLDPYSSSKACAELVTECYRSSYFKGGASSENMVSIATARAGNVIGGGDTSEARLIPDIFNSIRHREKLTIRYPDAVRPWQFVLEPLAGYLLLAEKLYLVGDKYDEPWNFGPNKEAEVPVRDLLTLFCDRWGEGAEWVIADGEQPYEALNLRLDSNKAIRRLSWKSSVYSMTQTVDEIVYWQKSLANKRNMTEISFAQIERYEKAFLDKSHANK